MLFFILFFILLFIYVMIVFIIPLKQSLLLREQQKKDTNPENGQFYIKKDIQINHAYLGSNIFYSIIIFLSSIATLGGGVWGIIGFTIAIILLIIAGLKDLYYLIQATRYGRDQKLLNPVLIFLKAQKSHVNGQDQHIDEWDSSFRFGIPVFITLIILWIILGISISNPYNAGDDFAVMMFLLYSILIIILFIISFRSSWINALPKVVFLIIFSFLIIQKLGPWN